MTRKLVAEAFGTFWLVFAGCGSALFAAGFPQLGIGFAGVSLAFGLTVLTMAYAVGPISGGHFNPAVTTGLAVAGRFSWSQVGPYIGAQLAGGIAAALVLYVILSGKAGLTTIGGFAANGFDNLSPGNYSMISAFVAEAVLTGFFLLIILGSTDKRAAPGFAPIAIGLALTLIHLVSIPITNTSVNPARSTSQALFAGGQYVEQLWLFWIAPIVGAAVAALIYKALLADEPKTSTAVGSRAVPA